MIVDKFIIIIIINVIVEKFLISLMNGQSKINLKSISVEFTEFFFSVAVQLFDSNCKFDSNKRFAGRSFANAFSSFFRFAIEFVSVVCPFVGRMFRQAFQNLLSVFLIRMAWSSHKQDGVKSIHSFPLNFPINFQTKSKS